MSSPQIQSPFGISLCPSFRVMMDFSDYNSIGVQRSCHDGLAKNASSAFLRLCSCAWRLHPLAVFPRNMESHGSHSMLIDLDFDLHSIGSLQYEQSKNDERESLFDSDEAATCPVEEAKETERRRKIGLANKGRVPWNKGRPHSPETRMRIRQRTIEAMRDPKVRRRMSESPRRHSDEVKAKISFSLRQLWEERLKSERAKENLYKSWAENIAEFARNGGVDEEELSWDSYDKMKREIALRNLEQATEKAKAKETKMTRAEKTAHTKANKKASLTQKIVETECREALVIRSRKKHLKPKDVEEESNLKARLTKIQKKKSVNGQISSQTPVMVSRYPTLERLDLQLIEREKMRQKVSLADEIRAAKSKRTVSTCSKALNGSFSLEE